jgi:transcriptional regulator with XRE-family HTH domain
MNVYRFKKAGKHEMTHTDAIIKRITNICSERKITVNRLADLSGLTQSTVDYVISGKTKNPRIMTLIKLANGLNMTVSELLDFPEMNEAIFDDE